MSKVVVVQRVLTTYRIAFYLELQREFVKQGEELVLLAGQPWVEDSLIDARDQLPFIRAIKNIRVFKSAYWSAGVLKLVRKADVVVLEQANSALVNYAMLLLRYVYPNYPRIVFWGHGAHLNKTTKPALADFWKRFISTKVDWWFAYTARSARIIKELGFSYECITVLNNAIDTSSLRKGVEGVSGADCEILHFRLFGSKRTSANRVGVFCGRLVPYRLVSLLLDSLVLIHLQNPDFRMIIIGAGSEQSAVERFAASRSWCAFVGEVFSSDLYPYYALADVWINPGASGLAILDAFASGLPFCTTSCGLHGPEIEYVVDGENGIITEPDALAFSENITSIIRSNKLNKLKKKAREDGFKYSIELMAKNFSEGISRVLST